MCIRDRDNRQTNEKIDSIKEDNRQTNEKIDGMKEEINENSRVQNEKMSENLIKQMEERFDQNREGINLKTTGEIPWNSVQE